MTDSGCSGYGHQAYHAPRGARRPTPAVPAIATRETGKSQCTALRDIGYGRPRTSAHSQELTMTNVARKMSETKQPNWWTSEHSSAWDRTKEAIRRDWEQTKADFSKNKKDLNQDVDDTLKQAAGKEPIPPRGEATPPSD